MWSSTPRTLGNEGMEQVGVSCCFEMQMNEKTSGGASVNEKPMEGTHKAKRYSNSSDTRSSQWLQTDSRAYRKRLKEFRFKPVNFTSNRDASHFWHRTHRQKQGKYCLRWWRYCQCLIHIRLEIDWGCFIKNTTRFLIKRRRILTVHVDTRTMEYDLHFSHSVMHYRTCLPTNMTRVSLKQPIRAKDTFHISRMLCAFTEDSGEQWKRSWLPVFFWRVRLRQRRTKGGEISSEFCILCQRSRWWARVLLLLQVL